MVVAFGLFGVIEFNRLDNHIYLATQVSGEDCRKHDPVEVGAQEEEAVSA